jgi:hypothetical protein
MSCWLSTIRHSFLCLPFLLLYFFPRGVLIHLQIKTFAKTPLRLFLHSLLYSWKIVLIFQLQRTMFLHWFVLLLDNVYCPDWPKFFVELLTIDDVAEVFSFNTITPVFGGFVVSEVDVGPGLGCWCVQFHAESLTVLLGVQVLGTLKRACETFLLLLFEGQFWAVAKNRRMRVVYHVCACSIIFSVISMLKITYTKQSLYFFGCRQAIFLGEFSLCQQANPSCVFFFHSYSIPILLS